MRIAIEQLQLEELQLSLREQAEDTFPDLKDAERLKHLSEKWHSHAEFCTCRDEDGRLIGMIAFYANQLEGRIAYIPHVYVNKDYRGDGVFEKLLNKVQEYVHNKGFNFLRLEVHTDNTRAQKAYLKYGFQKDGYAKKNSIFMKCII